MLSRLPTLETKLVYIKKVISILVINKLYTYNFLPAAWLRIFLPPFGLGLTAFDKITMTYIEFTLISKQPKYSFENGFLLVWNKHKFLNFLKYQLKYFQEGKKFNLHKGVFFTILPQNWFLRKRSQNIGKCLFLNSHRHLWQSKNLWSMEICGNFVKSLPYCSPYPHSYSAATSTVATIREIWGRNNCHPGG